MQELFPGTNEALNNLSLYKTETPVFEDVDAFELESFFGLFIRISAPAFLEILIILFESELTTTLKMFLFFFT